MSDTAETDMVVAADTGDSGFIRNLVQLARRFERELDEARRERDELRHALEWIVGQYGHEKTTAQLAIEAYEMFNMARWTLHGMKQKEEA